MKFKKQGYKIEKKLNFRLHLWLPAWHFPVGNADPHQRQRLRKHHCHGGRILCHRFTDGTHPSALRLATICSGNSISVARYHRNSGYFYRRLLFQKTPPSHALNGERRYLATFMFRIPLQTAPSMGVNVQAKNRGLRDKNP